ncbi:MAG: Spy/CpxP family protein refolding chaperone [Pirellulales bacterium]
MARFSKRTWLTVAAMVLALGQEAGAQRGEGRSGRGGRGFGVSPVRLVAESEEVQAALNITPEQKEKAIEISDQLREDTRGVFQQQRGNFREMRTEMEKLARDASAKLAEVLDAQQQKRLMGISVQVNGAAALGDPGMAKELSITEEQKAKLAEVREEVMRSMRDAFQEMRDQDLSREEMRAKLNELRADTDKKLLAVLTTEQQQRFEALKGEPVEIDLSQFRGGFEGRGRRGEEERGERGRDRDEQQGKSESSR